MSAAGPEVRDEGFPERPPPPWPWWLAAVAIAGGLLLLAPLALANLELDHREPHQAPARLWLGATLVAATAWAVVVARGLRAARGGIAGGAGLALGFPLAVPAMAVAADYGREGGGFQPFQGAGPFFAAAFYLVLFALAGGAAGLMAGLGVRRWPGIVLTVAGIAVGAGVAFAAVAMLATFGDQVREAREANEASAAGALALVAVAFVAAALARRARR